ncbi:MAG: tryptophan synthase subunit alpha [Chitinophagaceae bacterium]|nr:MAG: tryptophan synthase subunit alpha [Chitinophagaceae bacterium]
MSRLTELFDRKKSRILNVYCTAGYPGPDDTRAVLRALQAHGADIIELGMPYSDPLADGPVIQASSARALAGGMTIEKLFAQLEGFRNEIHLPLILMGYLNPLLQYGFDRFCARAAALGVDGLIIPDIPLAAFEREYKEILEQHGLHLVFLVTPETPEARVRQLDAASSGFLYAVSSSSVTGAVKDFAAVESYLRRLKELRLSNPVLVGAPISRRWETGVTWTAPRRPSCKACSRSLCSLTASGGTGWTYRSPVWKL